MPPNPGRNLSSTGFVSYQWSVKECHEQGKTLFPVFVRMNRMKTLNLCVIGAGSIYWNCHQKNISRMEGVNITALCDPSPESRKRAEEELGAVAFEGVDAWLETGPEVDAVLNFSPPFVRKQALEAAIRLNVPLFVEKPVAGSGHSKGN